ncbi:MAG: FAD-binding oxidoreductase [Pseudomonadota bacterium]
MAFVQNLNGEKFDVMIIGAGMYGSSIAWHLAVKLRFPGRVLVVEADPSFQNAATTHTNSCVRQQFTSEVNIKISQFMGDVIQDFPAYCADKNAPQIALRNFGYLYLADTAEKAEAFEEAAVIQRDLGVPIEHLSPLRLRDEYPFMNVEDIVLAARNTHNEGYFDGSAMFEYWQNAAMKAGVVFLYDRVVGFDLQNGQITSVETQRNGSIHVDQVVNAAGTQSPQIAKWAGQDLPIEPRLRMTYIFECRERFERDVPLVIDPSGVHVRWSGASFLAGAAPSHDVAPNHDDFTIPQDLWVTKVWPVLEHRVPAFEAVKVTSEWGGHYDYNYFDQNALLGRFNQCENLINASGFSGHGLQQSASIGLGLAELIQFNEYRRLDLGTLSVNRFADNISLPEKAII